MPKATKKARRRRAVPPSIDRRAQELPKGAEVFEALVESPYGGTVVVTKTRRADLLGNMLARKQIAQHQFAAGERLQNAFETAWASGVKSLDFSQPFVDANTPSSRSLISNSKFRAGNIIRKAQSVLGVSGFILVTQVLAERKTLEQIANERGESSALAEKHLGYFFRDCLNSLADAFGFTVRGPSHRPQPRDKHSKIGRKS